MLRLFILATFFICQLAFYGQETVQWMSWDQMVKKRATDSIKKKVFIDLYTGWCGWCKRMDGTTFKDPNIVSYMNQNYYSVKFDAETRDTVKFNNHTFQSCPIKSNEFEKKVANDCCDKDTSAWAWIYPSHTHC